jgi:urease subunit beta
LIPFAGARRIYGFSGGVMGPLESATGASGANE